MSQQQIMIRLSIRQLCSPIESLCQQGCKDQEDGGVDVTQDKFEALEGFAKLRTGVLLLLLLVLRNKVADGCNCSFCVCLAMFASR